MTMAKLNVTLSATLIAALSSGAAHAQIGRGEQPIQVNSDQFEYLQNEGRGVYTGRVVATQGDSRISTDKLTIVCSKVAKTAGGGESCEEVEQLIADANVFYTAPDVKIRGDKAVYDYPSDTITITGDVISSRGDEGVVRGTQIVYNVGEGRVKITAGNSRVLSIINTKKKDPAAQPVTPPATPAPTPARPN
jgi:lipopolysaccharide export system protein LptA